MLSKITYEWLENVKLNSYEWNYIPPIKWENLIKDKVVPIMYIENEPPVILNSNTEVNTPNRKKVFLVMQSKLDGLND